jgi:thymidylate synthase (FAD)
VTQVLDHGYARAVEHWGSDESIIAAARMSTHGEFRGWGPLCRTCNLPAPDDIMTAPPCSNPSPGKPMVDTGIGGHVFDKPGDEKLLRYLWEHKHATPFEMAGMTIEVQAPIFVVREWMRHRTQSYSEQSSRYVEMPELFYVPSFARLQSGGQSKSNKQASGELLHDRKVELADHEIERACARAFTAYRHLLGLGVARELARLVLPVNTYTRMRASANLRNWLAFLSLRLDDAAQYEIRVYAEAVHVLLAEAFPRTLALFDEGVSK